MGGIGLRRALLTLEGPLAPRPVRPFRCPSLFPWDTGLTGRSDMGTPPSVARTLLAREFRQATAKRHFEHSQTQFPAGCCRNNTRLQTPKNSLYNVKFGSRTRLRKLAQAIGLATKSILDRSHLRAGQIATPDPRPAPGQRRRQPKRRFEPKSHMPRASGKPRLPPAIPCRRFCPGSGRPSRHT